MASLSCSESNPNAFNEHYIGSLCMKNNSYTFVWWGLSLLVIRPFKLKTLDYKSNPILLLPPRTVLYKQNITFCYYYWAAPRLVKYRKSRDYLVLKIWYLLLLTTVFYLIWKVCLYGFCMYVEPLMTQWILTYDIKWLKKHVADQKEWLTCDYKTNVYFY